MRPPKINREIIDIFRNLVKEENLLLACTDEDMVAMLNEELFVEHRINYRTFQRYKARAIKEQNIPDADPLYLDLINILRMGYVRLRQQLLTAILKDHITAKRYMWVLERKFREWNIRAIPPVVVEEEQNEEEPILERTDQYPTITGNYYDLHHTERPKDISPVHHAVYQGYVIPNPNYEGPEDDTTRAIKRMTDMLAQDQLSREELEKVMGPVWAESEKRRQEEREREAAQAAEEAKAPPAGHGRMTWAKKLAPKPSRERLLNKIKNHRNIFHDDGTDENAWVPYEVDGVQM
ncbi:hypothetical protein BH09BAC1_BH09BAC1_02780 [soil metagenome]